MSYNHPDYLVVVSENMVVSGSVMSPLTLFCQTISCFHLYIVCIGITVNGLNPGVTCNSVV